MSSSPTFIVDVLQWGRRRIQKLIILSQLIFWDNMDSQKSTKVKFNKRHKVVRLFVYIYICLYRLGDPFNLKYKSFLENGMFSSLCLFLNKPAAQAAGADPSRCSFTNRQSPPIQQNRRNS